MTVVRWRPTKCFFTKLSIDGACSKITIPLSDFHYLSNKDLECHHLKLKEKINENSNESLVGFLFRSNSCIKEMSTLEPIEISQSFEKCNQKKL